MVAPNKVTKSPARRWLVAIAGCLALRAICPTGAIAAETLQIAVRETAGIRRFGYPVAVKLPALSIGDAKVRFRLREAGKPLPAQFRQEAADGGPGAWWLDFNLSMAPNELRTLTIEYGPDVDADAEPRGLELKQTAEGFEVRIGSYLTWAVGRDLASLLKSVDAGDLRYLRPEGVRLAIEGPNGALDAREAQTAAPRVVRSGPLAIAIRYELSPKDGPLAEMKAVVDLTFPVSKSWVQVDGRIDDPRQAVRSVRAEIAQNLQAPTEEEPTLVDFGAASLVYLSLAPGTAGKLRTSTAATPPNATASPRRSWEVLRGKRERLQPFVAQSADGGDAEGWAHVMDRSRCLALAVDEFDQRGADSIEVTAEGDVALSRRFAVEERGSPGSKHFRFWLHFVGFPPQVTAATSPPSMLSPLSVRISKP